MKLAKYKDRLYGVESHIVHEASDYMEKNEHYIRTTEIVDVEFKELPRDKVTTKEIAAIEKEMEKVQADCQVKLNGLEQQRQELLAIGFEEV